MVLSRDQFDVAGPVEPKRVEECFTREGVILHLHVAGRVVRTTAEHPFFVEGRGWTPAGELAVGGQYNSPNACVGGSEGRPCDAGLRE